MDRDITSTNHEVAQRFLDAANRHDVEAMASMWEPGGVENFPTLQQSYRVPQEFSAHFRALFQSFPDVQWDSVSITADDDLAVVRSTMHGTHLGHYQGLTATGKTFSVDTIDFLRVRDGTIVQNDVIFDGLTVLRQLGALPPAGSRRERALQLGFNSVTMATSRHFVAGDATITIARPPKDILEFVLDLDKYRQADHKFHRIHYVQRTNNHGLAKYSGRLRGIPTPTDIQEWMLDPYRRLEFKSVPSMWPGIIARFAGVFECEETDGGTVTRHVESFHFNPPFSWLAIPFLRSWLQRDVEDEVARLKRLIEAA